MQLFAVALTSQTIAQLFAALTHPPNSRSLICPKTQSHRSSPRPVIHLKRSLLPPIQLRRYFTVTIASKHNHAASSRSLLRPSHPVTVRSTHIKPLQSADNAPLACFMSFCDTRKLCKSQGVSRHSCYECCGNWCGTTRGVWYRRAKRCLSTPSGDFVSSKALYSLQDAERFSS